MRTKIIIGAIAIIAVGTGWYLFSDVATPQQESLENVDSNASGMRVEENMVVVMEQRPGTSVMGAIVYLAAPGYLVIHEDNNGEPGAVIGSSALLPSGESVNVRATLSRVSKDGETLHAMLYSESGNNTTFSATEDIPVQSSFGGPIHGVFEISKDAPEDIPVTI